MQIVIADPHPEVQSALLMILRRSPAVTGVGEANSLIELLALCSRACPDLILFDFKLVHPATSKHLADVICVLHRLCPHSRLVVMSSQFEAEQEALAAGADGYISKTDPPDEVLASIAGYLKPHS